MKHEHTGKAIPKRDLDTHYRIAGLYFYDHYGEALEVLREKWPRLARHPQLLPELLRLRGFCRVELGDLAGGLLDYAEALALDGDFTKVRKTLATLEHPALDRISELLNQKSWAAGEQLARACVAAFPDAERAQWGLAISLDELGRPDEAEPLLEALVQASPYNESYWFSLALVQRHRGRLTEASRVCQRGMALLEQQGRPNGELYKLLEWLDDEEGDWSDEGPGEEKALLN